MKVKFLTGLALLLFVVSTNAQTKKAFDDVTISIENAPVNTKSSDFASTIDNGRLIYNLEVKVQGKKKKESYMLYDVFSYQTQADGSLPKGGESESVFETNIQEGPMTVCEATGEMYLTQSYEKETDIENIVFKKEYVRLGITMFKRAEKGWVEVGQFPFASKEYSIGHPSVSQTGDTIVFISDMPGGCGGTDLYYSVRKNGEWQQPVNLGAAVNTAGMEMFPNWQADGTLFFASDGREGKGGLDIYYADFKDGKASDVLTFDNEINSKADDFGFIPGPVERYAYFTSNREGGQGGDDIYVVLPEEYKIQLQALSTFTEKPVPEAKIEVKNEKGKVVQEYTTDDAGNATLKLKMGERHNLLATKSGYYDMQKEINLTTEGVFANKEEVIYMDPSHRLRGQVVNILGDEPIEGADITIEREGLVVDHTQTDTNGYFKADIQPDRNYVVSAEADNFLATDIEFSTAGMEPGELFYYFQLYPLDAGTRIGLNNIYYDFNKYNIRQDAARVLDRMSEALLKYQDIDIRLEAHTDSRGTDEYNQKLSERRAKATLDYLVRKGIDRKRMEGIGLGETQLVNECGDGVDCSEEKHQENRRTVFEIMKSKKITKRDQPK